MHGYLRQDGRKGIRNHAVVAFLVECARHVAEEVAEGFRDRGVQLIGFPSCYPSAYGDVMLRALATHPNVGAVLLISLGCESFRGGALELAVTASARPARLLTIQQSGGTRSTIAAGSAWLDSALDELEAAPIVDLAPNDLTIGLLPGKAGLETCRVLGQVTDRLLSEGATVILEDAAKGRDLSDRGVSTEIELKLASLAQRAARCRRLFGEDTGSSGVSHQAAGMAKLADLLHPAEQPRRPGLYLLDNVPDSEPRHGPIDLGPAVAAAELAACGAQLLVAAADDGELGGASVVPVVRLCADPQRLAVPRDEIDATNEGEAMDAIHGAGGGRKTSAERLGYCDFALAHKDFEATATSRP